VVIKIQDGSSAKWEMFGNIHPRLGQIFYDFCNKCRDMKISEVIITSIIRPHEDDSGVHALGRGLDISKTTIPETIGLAIMETINEKYVYDIMRPSMKVCIYHDVGKGLHYHLQCGE
jgi:hypothetical protein